MDINEISHVVNSLDELSDWAGSRETSEEIAYSIMTIAKNKAASQMKKNFFWVNGK